MRFVIPFSQRFRSLIQRLEPVSFFQNFGSTLNVHPHFHIMITDGAFAKQAQTLKFLPATITQADIKKTEEQICSHVLHYLQRKKILTSDEVGKMLAKDNTGFSLDGGVSIQSWDRCGLERIFKILLKTLLCQ